MKVALLLALLLQEEPAPNVADPKPLAWRVDGGTDVAYTTNTLRLSQRDIRQLERGSRPDKFRIESAEDFVYSPGLEAALVAPILSAPSTIGLRAQAHLYQRNSILNHEEVALFLRHRMIEFEYTYLPEVYRREYRALDSGEFTSAFYAEHDLELGLGLEPVARLKLRPEAGVRLRDYESPFDYRDSIAYAAGAGLSYEPAPWLELGVRYGFVANVANAEPTEPDTSYVEHGVEPGIALKPSAAWELGLRYRIAQQEYTTDNDPAIDPGHRDRTDDIRRLRFLTRWKVAQGLVLDAEVRRSEVDSTLPADASATDDESSWERMEYVMGVTYRF